jgi:hypothetical protein
LDERRQTKRTAKKIADADKAIKAALRDGFISSFGGVGFN